MAGTRGFGWLKRASVAVVAEKSRSARTAGAGATRQIDRQIGDERDGLPLHGAHRGPAKDRPSNSYRDVDAPEPSGRRHCQAHLPPRRPPAVRRPGCGCGSSGRSRRRPGGGRRPGCAPPTRRPGSVPRRPGRPSCVRREARARPRRTNTLCFAQCDLDRNGRIDQTVHGDNVLFPDYLIEFEIVDMPGRAPFRTVQDQ